VTLTEDAVLHLRFAWRTTFGSPGPRSAMLLRRARVPLWTAMLTLVRQSPTLASHSVKACFAHAASVGP